MNRIYCLALLCIFFVSSTLAQTPPPFFVNFSTIQWGEFQPSAQDPEFDFNEETGMYEIVVPYDVNQPDRFMRFYQRIGDEIKQWSPLVRTHVALLDDRAYEVYIEEDRTSPLIITDFYANLEHADVKISTVPNDTTLYLRQIITEEYIPDRIFVWGSNDGGFHSKIFGAMTHTEENPYLYTLDMTMPTWQFDPENLMADFAADLFFFNLSTTDDPAKKGTTFKAYLPPDTGDPQYCLINLEKGQTFTTTLQTYPQDSAPLMCVTPGKTSLTFNLKTYEFTATMLEPMNHIVVNFSGLPTAVHGKYLTIAASGKPYPLFINPESIWYDGSLDLTVTPKEGFGVRVDCLTPDATIDMSSSEGVYHVKSDENGLEFDIFLFEIKDEQSGVSGPDLTTVEGRFTVYSLQGISLIKNGSREELLRLPAGIYIVNGRKHRL